MPLINPATVKTIINSAPLIIQGASKLIQMIKEKGLALIPILLGVGFLVLGFSPVLAVLVVVQVLRRAGNYAITRPSREMLYTVVSKEEKYKAKNFIDTAVYRGGDAVSAWAYTALTGLGLSLSVIAFVAVPLAAIWGGVSYMLGRKREVLAKGSEPFPT